MSGQIYQVPIVSNGLRETESILQIVDSLEKLERVFNDIYSNISTRVSLEKSRIDSVSDRLENAQFKVKQITGSKSAITIFSSAKYPAEKKWLDYKPLNNGKEKLPYKPSHYHGLHHDPSLKKKNEDSFLEVNDLVFIEKSIDAASKEIERKEGLGKLPNHLSSVSNLLLFNTGDNPYKKYSNTLDNLAGGEGDEPFQIFGDQKSKKKIADAPVTVESGDALLDPTRENYKYSHSNFTRPSMQFEENLPLPNIAQNISFQNLDNSTIAPSNTTTNSLPIYDTQSTPSNLSTSPPLPYTSGSGNSNNTTTTTLDINTPGLAQPMPSSSTSSGAPPPPPPPPSPPIPPTFSNNIPLPPPSLGLPVQLKDEPNQSTENSDGTQIGDLLADIRRGHKNRLKKREENGGGGDEEGDNPPPPPKSGGGDVMSDLFLALSRRRESIASVKKKPTSTKKAEYSDEEQSDSDWDDK